MKISVWIKAGATCEQVEKIGAADFLVAVTAPPEKGRANEAAEKAVAKYFRVAPSRVRIVSGRTSRRKIIDVLL